MSVLQGSIMIFDGITANISLHKTSGLGTAEIHSQKGEKMQSKFIQLQIIFSLSYFGAAVE